MKIYLTQPVKIEGDRFLHSWTKSYESSVIPRKGDWVEDPLWKDPGEYEITGITINYYADSSYVDLKEHERKIPRHRQSKMASMAELHGWKCSWKN